MAAEAEVEVGRGIDVVSKESFNLAWRRLENGLISVGLHAAVNVEAGSPLVGGGESLGRWLDGGAAVTSGHGRRRPNEGRDGDVLGICIEVVARIAIVVVAVVSCRVVGSGNGSDGQRGRG